MISDEQMYLPSAVEHSRRNICALATSSTWTIGVFIRYLYTSLSSAMIFELKEVFFQKIIEEYIYIYIYIYYKLKIKLFAFPHDN